MEQVTKQYCYKNISISYTDAGKGNTVVLLHGFLENKEIWTSIGKTLAQKYRVITIDLLGHGASDCLGYIHTMEDQSDMLFALLTSLKLRKISFVGHSMGGYVALAFAEFHPDYLRHLILLNSSSLADSAERKVNRARAIDVVKKNAGTFVRMAITNLFTSTAQETFKAAIDNLITQAMKTPVQGIVASLEGMKVRPDREALLHFGPYPKLIIAGSDDPIIPLREIEEQIVGNDTVLKIVVCGHMAWLEKEKEVTELFLLFLKK